jgi:hypothetical protein
VPLSIAALASLVGWWIRPRPGRSSCPSCNYDLSGLPPGSPCPECAAAPPTTHRRADTQ